MRYVAGAFNGGEIIQRRQALAPCQWRQRELKVGGRSAEGDGRVGRKQGVPLPTGGGVCMGSGHFLFCDLEVAYFGDF